MRMAVIKVIVVAAALFAAITPARAEMRILASPGGAGRPVSRPVRSGARNPASGW